MNARLQRGMAAVGSATGETVGRFPVAGPHESGGGQAREGGIFCVGVFLFPSPFSPFFSFPPARVVPVSSGFPSLHGRSSSPSIRGVVVDRQPPLPPPTFVGVFIYSPSLSLSLSFFKCRFFYVSRDVRCRLGADFHLRFSQGGVSSSLSTIVESNASGN